MAAVPWGHLPDGTLGLGVTSNVEEDVKKLKKDLQKEFADVFLGELGVDDHISVEPVKLKVRQEVADPYHCLSPASIIFTLTDYMNH